MSHSRTKALPLTLLGFFLLLAACHKRPPAPAVPLPPNYLQLGEGYFEAGDYANASQAYETYLRGNASPGNRDRVLLRLALAYSFPQSPVRDPARAKQLLQQLVNDFPKSPFKSPAEFLLRVQEEVESLRADLSKRNERMSELTLELEKLKQSDLQRRSLQESLSRLQEEMETLKADLRKRNERIKELTLELERLRQIDLGRRPSRVPPK